MRGKMLWFNDEKGHGFIRTEEDERLQVDRDGFVGGEPPVGRCVDLDVTFEVVDGTDGRRAVGVELAPDIAQRRARLRRGRSL